MVGVVVLGLAVALSVVIYYQPLTVYPPEVLRALAIPTLYLTIGLLAIIGALQRRRAIVIAAGLLCLAGAIVSVATLAFAVPGLLLIVLGSRVHVLPTGRQTEAVIATAVVLLVAGESPIDPGLHQRTMSNVSPARR